MSINRYKFLLADIPKVKAFLKDNEKTNGVPHYAKKFKADITIKRGKLYYQDREIVPRENVEDYLRDKLYSKDATIPFGRDSAHYSLLKTTVGISRRVLYDWLMAQKNIVDSKPSLPKPKLRSGIKRKKLTLGTDLIFVRREDLIRSNPKFENDNLKQETYIITTVENCSGLVQLSYLQSKDQTNAALEKHIHWFAKTFQVKPSDFALESDKGSEYSMSRIKRLIPDYKFVASQGACERKNRQVQANFYRILKNRQATTIKDALKKAQDMANNTVSRKHKKTPTEVVETSTKKKIIENHNKTRATFIAGDKRKPYKVGDWVRVMAPEKVRRGIAYKSYKGVAYEKEVKKIIKVTKRAQPTKYRLSDKKWYTQYRLMKTRKVDKKSQKLIKERDEEEEKKDQIAHDDFQAYQAAVDVVKDAEQKTGEQMITRKTKKFMKKLKAQRLKEKKQLKAMEAAEREDMESDDTDDTLDADTMAPHKPKPKPKAKAKKKAKKQVVLDLTGDTTDEEDEKPKSKRIAVPDPPKVVRFKPVKQKDVNVSRANAYSVSQYKRQVDFIRGEKGKVYKGRADEKEKLNLFNTAVMMGQEYARVLKQDKVRLVGYSLNFFNKYR